MDVDIDIFVGNNTLLDPEIYGMWLSGQEASDGATSLIHGSLKNFDVDYGMLLSDVLDHYRTFQMLERLLHYPKRLTEQWIFQIAPSIQRMLIERYYEFDDAVIREFLGKKLSARNRKDLDDVSEKTGIQVKSCRRQFDNVKRVYKVVEDTTTDLVNCICSTFLLSENLARKYAGIMYLTNNRCETSRKKLQYLTFEDFLFCANWMMCNWSCSKLDCTYEETAMEMDRDFLQDLRDLKQFLEKDVYDDLKSVVLGTMRSVLTDRLYTDLDSNFKFLTRTFVNIGSGLNHSKEVRDLFVDIVEKFIETFRQSRWAEKDLRKLLETYTEAGTLTHLCKSDPHMLEVWERYMTVMSNIIMRMFHT
ncbi:acidic fibroblast growth factor intracellular-binding protein [Parasteatoda tepidariorum]|uniref:acidic fibroblast growth factor intracellular-binding protein n=1 Tax=Parasteatoda tepidariorum TaxID=114398 RepID=UPI00077FD765|nr:acidic fibroblast growth factor intracellular-binding protein [Parasteatoda tepidariorum]XP_042898037.1 acidic fibroblast growth factor intracellular-binding protein [Parasteatoda tepidariorum]